MRSTQRNVFLLAMALAAGVIVLAVSIELRRLPRANSVRAEPPEFVDPRAHPARFNGVPALEWDLRYHVGLSRDQIRPNCLAMSEPLSQFHDRPRAGKR